LGLVRATQWQESIHGMLMQIPFISINGIDSYFRSIDYKLFAYEGSTMLELAIWKSKIVEQTEGVIIYPLDAVDADLKMACRIDSLTMVDIIVPNGLSFLRGHANEGEDNDGDDEGEDDEDDGDMSSWSSSASLSSSSSSLSLSLSLSLSSFDGDDEEDDGEWEDVY
jgi:hypothetical protein